ncbi:MAG: YidC/Oxa1 family membrane protein insertase [Bacillota bacterium]|nr:YidC/Oxa1 family membrane protein insertase [Bacillota bacterium]
MKWLADLLTEGIALFYSWTGSYGLAIILLTVAVRLILLPVAWSGAVSTARMQALGPEMEELRRRYRNEPRKLNEAQLELWRRHGVNPFAGCLSMVIEFPVIIALFQALSHLQYAGGASFLWVPHLARPDPYYVLPTLAAAATYWQARVSTPPSAGGGTGMMLLSLAMGPAMMFYFTARYGAGLGLYWTLSTALRALQQYLTPQARRGRGGAPGEENREEGSHGGRGRAGGSQGTGRGSGRGRGGSAG